MNDATSQPAVKVGDAVERDPLYGRGVAMIMVAGCFFSLGGLLVRLVEDAGPWQILLVRSIMLSATVFVVLVVRHRGKVFAEFRKCGITAVIGALCLGVAFTGFIFSLLHTTVANAVFILCASPFFTAPLALFAVAGFAGFAVALRWGRDTDMLALACLAGLFTAVVAAVMSPDFAMSAYDTGLCVIMGVVQMSAGMVLFTKGSRLVPAAELTLLSLTEVVLAPIWVWLWIGEVPRLWTLLGGAVVLAAIIGHAITGMRRKPAPYGAV